MSFSCTGAKPVCWVWVFFLNTFCELGRIRWTGQVRFVLSRRVSPGLAAGGSQSLQHSCCRKCQNNADNPGWHFYLASFCACSPGLRPHSLTVMASGWDISLKAGKSFNTTSSANTGCVCVCLGERCTLYRIQPELVFWLLCLYVAVILS